LSSQDSQFLEMFTLVLGSIVGVTFGIFLLARYIAGETQDVQALQDPTYQEQLELRISPVGRVALPSDEVTVAETPYEALPAKEVLSGPQVYNTACFACHGAGIGGAPKVGDAAVWSDRIAQGAVVLNQRALEGYQGTAGYMPPKGGRVDLSDEEIIAAVEYMISESR
jgi:cytochrome c5